MNCKNCNGMLKIDTERKLLICPYCGATEPFDSTSKEEIQELLKDALKDANQENQRMMERMMATHRQEMELANTERTSSKVALYVILTVAACFAFIMAMFGLDTEYKASGVVALIQFGLLIAAIILKAASKNDSEKKSASVAGNFCMIAAALLVIVWVIALGVASNQESSKKTYMDEIYARDYYWPDEGFAKVVPRWGEQPDYSYAGEREFSATILNATDEVFASYVEQCKKEGFSIDVTEDATDFNAYDEEGNELDLNYIPSADDRPIYVKMYKALEFGNLVWPTQGMMKEVPQPEAEEMMVESMSADFFKAYVNIGSREKFLAYVQECMDAGFDGRYEAESDNFYGDKGDIRLSMELKRNRIILITVYD